MLILVERRKFMYMYLKSRKEMSQWFRKLFKQIVLD